MLKSMVQNMPDRSSQSPGKSEKPDQQIKKTASLRIANRYEVVTKLAGGMAFVYLCRDHESNQPVALKIFKPELLSHRIARDLFLREGTMWVELGMHPHIVRALRVERIGDGREVYLVLEWVMQPKGKSTPALRSWLIPGRPLPLEQALLFSLHVTRGMKYATTKISGLVHRDLKPENILISHDGKAKVTDFGLASTLSGMGAESAGISVSKEDFGRTQLTQGVVGTPLYMAPEQWRHERLDTRADIYALGCILYEMVTGHYAVVGKSREELKENHLAGKIKPPPSTVPREVVMLLRRCLVADRGKRFLNWAEFEEAIVQVYRSVTGEAPHEEREAAGETKAERLAAGNSYNEMGLSYLDIGKLDVAVMYFEQAVTVGRTEGSRRLEGQGLGNLGLAYSALGYVERAIDFHEEHLAIARAIGDPAEEGQALGDLGRAYRRLGQIEEAISFHDQELAIARQLSDGFKEAAALDSLGATYWAIDDPEKKARAVPFFKQSLAIARSIEDQSRVKSILNSMGRIFLASGEMKEAKALFHQSRVIAKKMGDRVGEGEALGDLGDMHNAAGEVERAKEFYQLALKISRESNDRRRELANLIRFGDLFVAGGDVEEAIMYYTDALAAVTEMGDRSFEFIVMNKLGGAYSTLGDYMQAASLYRRIFEQARASGDRAVQQQALLDLGASYEGWGDLRRKAGYLKQHLEISREAGDRESELEMLHKLALLYVEMKELQTAFQVYSEILALCRESGDHILEAAILNERGDVYRRVGSADRALENYQAAMQVAVANQDQVAEAVAMGNIAMAYSDLGKKWQARRYGERAVKTAHNAKSAGGVAMARYKLAVVHYQQKKWSNAHSNASKAQLLFAKLGDQEQADRMTALLERIERQR